MTSWRTLEALTRQLELCGVGPANAVALISDDSTPPSLTAALAIVLERLDVVAVSVSPSGVAGIDQLLPGAPFDAALREVDLVLDSTAAGALAEARRRSLDGPPVLHLTPLAVDAGSWRPHTQLRARANAMAETCSMAGSLTVSDEHGTELLVGLESAAVHSRHSLLSEDEPSAAFPSGSIEIHPGPDAVAGSLMLLPGDAVFPLGQAIRSPVRIDIAHDRVTDVHGDGSDNDTVRMLFTRDPNPDARCIGSLSIGLHARPDGPLLPFEAGIVDPGIGPLVAGAVSVSFGQNPVAGRSADGIVRFVMARRSVRAGDVDIVGGGQLLGEFEPDTYELAATT